MPYSDFTLKKAKEQLGIKVVENQDLFASVPEISISEYLSATLKGTSKNTDLAEIVIE